VSAKSKLKVVLANFEVIQEHYTQSEKRFIMPTKRTANKSNKSFVKDSSATSSVDRTNKTGAEGCSPASFRTAASKLTRESTRTRREAENRSASVDAVSATAPDTLVSLANSSETVVIPRDRENQGGPIRGNGYNDVTQQAGSNVGNFQGQGSGISRVFVDDGWGNAVPPDQPVANWPSYSDTNSISADLLASFTHNQAEYPAVHGISADFPASLSHNRADYPATHGVSAVYPATLTQYPSDYPATIYASAPRFPNTVVQHLPILSPRGSRGGTQTEVLNFLTAGNTEIVDKHPTTREHANSGRNHRRSLSASGYD